MSFQERKGNQIPGRFQCSICGTYKSADNFSKNELKGAQWQKSQNPAMNGRSARIRCSKCTGQQRHELECLKCGDVLEISKFSKTSKKAGGNQWCIECTMYKESALPDFEQTEVASRAVTSQHNHGENGTNCTQTGWGGDMTASSAVGGRTSFVQPPSFANATGPESFADKLSRMQAENLRGPLSTKSPPSMQGYVPPHLRAKAPPAGNGSVSSISNPFEDARTSITPSAADTEPEDDGWNTVVPQRKPFHAWGPQGQHQMRTTSGPSSAVNTPPISSANTPALTPAPPSAPVVSRTGGWAKPVGNRKSTGTQAHCGFTVPESKEYNNQYDSEDSDDDP